MAMTQAEVWAVISELRGIYKLLASLRHHLSAPRTISSCRRLSRRYCGSWNPSTFRRPVYGKIAAKGNFSHDWQSAQAPRGLILAPFTTYYTPQSAIRRVPDRGYNPPSATARNSLPVSPALHDAGCAGPLDRVTRDGKGEENELGFVFRHFKVHRNAE